MGFFPLLLQIVLEDKRLSTLLFLNQTTSLISRKLQAVWNRKVQLSSHLSVPLSWEDGLVSPSDGLGHQWRPDPGPLTQ